MCTRMDGRIHALFEKHSVNRQPKLLIATIPYYFLYEINQQLITAITTATIIALKTHLFL